jgi:uncharacterized protein (DUF58 family)
MFRTPSLRPIFVRPQFSGPSDLKTLRSFIREFHLTPRFFLALGIVVVLFCVAFAFPIVHGFAVFALCAAGAGAGAEIMALWSEAEPMRAARQLPKLFSLGDDNAVRIRLNSTFGFPVRVLVTDELPFQLQKRDFAMHLTLKAGEERILRYDIRPIERGAYEFGVIRCLLTTPLGFVARNFSAGKEETLPVYPSVLQMKRIELMAFARISTFEGVKKVRRLGHGYEFEQIRQYAIGDDVRTINQKATARRGTLMVNQYEAERAQQIYCIIDKGRSMRMPFHGLSLFDHAVNTSLVISNIALRMHDKAGYISFSDRIGATLKAERKPTQLRQILESLYAEKEHAHESDFELLYQGVRNVVKNRSLLFLFTNFESLYALERVLPLLRLINHFHLLVVIVFQNTELSDYARKRAEYLTDIYTQTLAEKLIADKKEMLRKLRKYRIQAIYTKPEDLSVNTLNKYLELKAKGMI